MAKNKPQYLNRRQMMDLTREVLKVASGTQAVIAERLGVTQSAISQAVNDESSKTDAIRVKIIREIGGRTVTEDLWLVE